METTGTRIIAIIKSSLNADATITLEQAQTMLNEAKFDIEETGYNDIKVLLEDLCDYFELTETANGTIVKCKGVKTNESPAAVISEEKPRVELDEKLVKKVNDQLVNVLRELIKSSSDSEGKIPLTDLGQKRAELKIELPNNEKLGAYLKRFPELFELNICGTDSYVRLAGSPIVATTAPAQKKAATGNVQKRFVSLYHLFDFACFPDYNSAKAELASIAVPDGWFVIPESNESNGRDPYCLIDYKLREKFALTACKQLQGEEVGIHLYLDHAMFDTGFTTSEGNHIIANFKLNQHKDSTTWQTWLFDGFSTESK